MRGVSALLIMLALGRAAEAATMETEVTLNLGITGMNSFAAYTYTYDTLMDPTASGFEQYHVIVNGDAAEWSTVNTDDWTRTAASTTAASCSVRECTDRTVSSC